MLKHSSHICISHPSCSSYPPLLVSAGMKELSPPPLNLRRLYAETLELEPVLITISPGADPSQELAELAVETVGRENYHEVESNRITWDKIIVGCEVQRDIFKRLPRVDLNSRPWKWGKGWSY